MEEAAGIPETYFTVWANVFQIGGLREGERMLVHGGASGIGTTAIQLGRAFGAEVFVTAGSEAKCEACLKLGAMAAINYLSQDFVHEIRALTPHGVNLVLDIVGGPYTPRNIECLVMHGRLVQVAVQQGAEATINLAKIMQKRLVLTGSTMRPRSVEDKAQIARELESRVWPLLAARKVHVVVDRVFPFDEVVQAHRYLESGAHIGKVILKLI
jgi:putative PIG3 family NAD(P)H quinone oxidoreductase